MNSVSGFKKMNWFPKASAWNAAETQRAQRREMMAAFQERSASLAAGFSKAQAIQIQGVGDLAVQNVQSRLQARAEEMRSAADAKFASFDKLV